ncbi:DUF2798 domain-containing protein [Rhodobacteraceae bacterium WD3A24]|nr:DUF2798 domain-containing protein [Rhodobacteraceae bacterium WD3A24]
MIPSRYTNVLFALILSGIMSCIVSGISILRNAGFVDGVFRLWMEAWLPSFAVSFPLVLILAPLTRRLVAVLVR